MKVKELIERLQRLDPDKEIMVKDGFNGGGVPREINFGPVGTFIGVRYVDESADCEHLRGQEVYTIGFGCY